MLFELLVGIIIFLVLFSYATKPTDKSLKLQIQTEISGNSHGIISNLVDTIAAKTATGFGATFDIKDFIIFKMADVKLSDGEWNMYLGIMQHWIPITEFAEWIENIWDDILDRFAQFNYRIIKTPPQKKICHKYHHN